MHLSTASFHEYIYHRNFTMIEELLVVLRDTGNYIKGILVFSEMQDSQYSAKGKGNCSVALKILSFLLQCFEIRVMGTCTFYPDLDS